MKRLVMAGLLVAAMGMLAADAQAFGFRKKKCQPSCAPACAPASNYTVQYVTKKVTCYKTEWAEKDVEVVVHRVKTEREEVKYKYWVCKPVWKEETRKVSYYRTVPHEVERDVVSCSYQTVCCVDPCTGCTYTCRKPVQTVHKVKCTVYKCIREEKDVTVKVCSYEREEKEGNYTRVKCVPYTTKETRKVRYCVSVPHEVEVQVAVCVPYPTPCGSAVVVGHGGVQKTGDMPYAK